MAGSKPTARGPLSKQFSPPPLPSARAAQPRQAPPQPRGQRPVAPPPPVPPRSPAIPAAAQRFASFANRSMDRGAKPAPAGDELVPLGSGNFGARDSARGLVTRPDGTYNFVRTEGTRRVDQRLLISSKAGHVQLSGGRPVVYAGTVRFSGGALDWWSNYSGHYQPVAAFRAQAQLPEEKFVPWQRLQIGGTAMQRGMFRDRRPSDRPAAAETSESGAAAAPGAAARDEKPAAASSARTGTAPSAKESTGKS